jgi:hypothetical protein
MQKQPNKITRKPRTQKRNLCGIVMPLSLTDGCPKEHWIEVRQILSDAIDSAGFEAHIVSDADDVGIIQKRIIQNIYENPIIVCDVSGKNPNVMFELGLRLAFDKPAIIVKDDKTTYSFDTAPIEHIDYPRDLRFSRIVEFKEELSEKIKGTYNKATTDQNYTPFLKHFGTFTPAKIDIKDLSQQDIVLEEIRTLRQSIMEREYRPIRYPSPESSNDFCLRKISRLQVHKIMDDIYTLGLCKPNQLLIKERDKEHFHLKFIDVPNSIREEIFFRFKKSLPTALINSRGFEHSEYKY